MAAYANLIKQISVYAFLPTDGDYFIVEETPKLCFNPRETQWRMCAGQPYRPVQGTTQRTFSLHL